jgi:hypothetical protein
VNTLTEQERQEGGGLLWDGKSGDGWRSIKNEVSCQGMGNRQRRVDRVAQECGRRRGDIITRETYSSFILKWTSAHGRGQQRHQVFLRSQT